MSAPPRPPADPVGDLSVRADALERATARASAHAGHQATSQAYRIVADLFGGVIVGLALGGAVDWLFKVTKPWGLIAGVLAGFAVSVWMAKRTADRLMAQAAADNTTPAASIPFDDDDEDART